MHEVIKIGPMVFSWVVEENLRNQDDTRLDGHIMFDTMEIKTDASISGLSQRETLVLWHEIVHGIAEFYGVALDEKDVDQLAKGVMDVVINNRWLVERTK